jgi:hypothetical protein
MSRMIDTKGQCFVALGDAEWEQGVLSRWLTEDATWLAEVLEMAAPDSAAAEDTRAFLEEQRRARIALMTRVQRLEEVWRTVAYQLENGWRTDIIDAPGVREDIAAYDARRAAERHVGTREPTDMPNNKKEFVEIAVDNGFCAIRKSAILAVISPAWSRPASLMLVVAGLAHEINVPRTPELVEDLEALGFTVPEPRELPEPPEADDTITMVGKLHTRLGALLNSTDADAVEFDENDFEGSFRKLLQAVRPTVVAELGEEIGQFYDFAEAYYPPIVAAAMLNDEQALTIALASALRAARAAFDVDLTDFGPYVAIGARVVTEAIRLSAADASA